MPLFKTKRTDRQNPRRGQGTASTSARSSPASGKLSSALLHIALVRPPDDMPEASMGGAEECFMR
jgi:hypothetical protein